MYGPKHCSDLGLRVARCGGLAGAHSDNSCQVAVTLLILTVDFLQLQKHLHDVVLMPKKEELSFSSIDACLPVPCSPSSCLLSLNRNGCESFNRLSIANPKRPNAMKAQIKRLPEPSRSLPRLARRRLQARKIFRYATKYQDHISRKVQLSSRLKSFESSVGLSRKAFRLGKFVQHINALRN
ncbi:uncharacterized protein LOC111315376 [Durio zibethinus]|uniref:Uncharacterized protein LOC111315376 n=1 Tax=Durio zibethinus TaxID=66656 RepID=A0A6P6B6I7_DURZI|nr:uncharacterized protein LOC111315376 [Durio zibethinus]